MPINKRYTAIERAVVECAYAGCETIWIICHDDMQPLIRYRLGDYVQDPLWINKNRLLIPEGVEKPIPIYYVPIHPKDRDKRDCLGWSVLHGAQTAYWLSKTISQWVTPDKYYVAFPYGVFPSQRVRSWRSTISKPGNFLLATPEGNSVIDNEFIILPYFSGRILSAESFGDAK